MLVLGLLVAGLLPPVMAAQAPDLSGTWTLVDNQAGPGLAPFGDRFTALQNDALLSVELTSLYVMGHTQPTERHPTLVFRFDGSETRHPLLALATGAPAMSSMTTGFRTEHWVTRAGWEGDRLVIVTYAERRVQDPFASPESWTHRAMTRQELWIDDAGRLVVETSGTADPVSLASSRVARMLAQPEPSRVLYERAASVDAGR